MTKEFEFLNIINNTLSDSSYLGDDCAYLDEFKLAVSQDTLIEDVHFSRVFMTPYEIAQKALLVNISDILASGAKPLYASISLGGDLDCEFIKEFYSGINEIAQDYNLKITGGDLVKSTKLMISITILGSYKGIVPSSRKNAKEGYVVAVLGEFGSSARGLLDLKKGNSENYFTNCHKKPILYPEFSASIAKNAKHPYAMMDSSDGLVDCLWQISKKSNVKIEIDYDKIPRRIQDKDLVLYGGEDYSLVLCLHEDDFNNIEGPVKIGVCKKGLGVFADDTKIKYKGYEHFE